MAVVGGAHKGVLVLSGNHAAFQPAFASLDGHPSALITNPERRIAPKFIASKSQRSRPRGFDGNRFAGNRSAQIRGGNRSGLN